MFCEAALREAFVAGMSSPQSRYLLAQCSMRLGKLREAEQALRPDDSKVITGVWHTSWHERSIQNQLGSHHAHTRCNEGSCIPIPLGLVRVLPVLLRCSLQANIGCNEAPEGAHEAFRRPLAYAACSLLPCRHLPCSKRSTYGP